MWLCLVSGEKVLKKQIWPHLFCWVIYPHFRSEPHFVFSQGVRFTVEPGLLRTQGIGPGLAPHLSQALLSFFIRMITCQPPVLGQAPASMGVHHPVATALASFHTLSLSLHNLWLILSSLASQRLRRRELRLTAVFFHRSLTLIFDICLTFYIFQMEI